MSARILVTGGGGYLGSQVVAALAAAGDSHVVSLDVRQVPPQRRLPCVHYETADIRERAALTDQRDALSQQPPDSPAEKIQEVVYEVGRRPPFLDTTGKIKTKDGKPGVSLEWFNMLYQVLLGQEKGPRFGSFVAVYGLANTIEMIDGALARSA